MAISANHWRCVDGTWEYEGLETETGKAARGDCCRVGPEKYEGSKEKNTQPRPQAYLGKRGRWGGRGRRGAGAGQERAQEQGIPASNALLMPGK